MNRRTFVQASIATAALTSLPVKVLAAEDHKIEKIGMQLYTVRDAMKADFAGTIAKVAGIGYKELEFAGYYDQAHLARDFREFAGLTPGAYLRARTEHFGHVPL